MPKDFMKNTVIAVLLLFLLPVALLPSGLAQDSEEPCSARETVYPRVKTAILDEASYGSQRVRHADAWAPLEIIGSRRFGPWCWLQVSDGWLIGQRPRPKLEAPRFVRGRQLLSGG